MGARQDGGKGNSVAEIQKLICVSRATAYRYLKMGSDSPAA
jgi:transposase